MYFNNNYSSLDRLGANPKTNMYANSLIQNKQAAFNHANQQKNVWKVETKCKYLCISSSERNIKLYPDINYYSIPLDEPLYNVHSVTIIRGDIPKGEYTVNENNNVLNLSKGGVDHSITLEIGEYDIITYTDLLNNELGFLNIDVEFNALLSKFKFTCIDPDDIIFYLDKHASPYFEFGFEKEIVEWDTMVLSKNKINLFGTQELTIHMEELNKSDTLIDCIFFKTCQRLINFDYNNPLIKDFEPHKQINNITLKFINSRYNTLYNFNGLEHTLCICFRYYKYVSPILLPELKSNTN